jgi:hypothetical protein
MQQTEQPKKTPRKFPGKSTGLFQLLWVAEQKKRVSVNRAETLQTIWDFREQLFCGVEEKEIRKK